MATGPAMTELGGACDERVDDLIELATSVGGQSGVCVLGYSFGGMIAIEAAKTAPAAIHALVAYEPPYGGDRLVSASPELESMLDEGRLEDAARLFITSTFHLTDSVVDAMRRHPMWEITIGVLPRLRRELPAVEAARVTPAAGVVPPTRVLVAESGGNPAFGEIASALSRAIGSETVTVPGLPHFAMATDPEPFVDAVLEHLQRAHTS